MPTKPKENIAYWLILAAILAGAIYFIYQIANNPKFKALRSTQPEPSASEIVGDQNQDDSVLDCSKKIAQNQDQLKTDDDYNCLFLGCGDFFQ